MVISKKRVLNYIFLTIIFFTSFIPLINYISIVIIIFWAVLYMKNLIYNDSLILISSIYVFFTFGVLIVGNLLLEISYANVFKQSNILFTGSTTRLIVYIIFFYEAFSKKMKKMPVKSLGLSYKSDGNYKKNKIYFFIILLGIISCQIICINALRKYGIAIGDRFFYERTYMNSIEVLSKWILVKSSFFVGWIYTFSKKTKKKILLLINIISIIILKMLGIKFGEIFLNISYFLMPITLKYIWENGLYIHKKYINKGIGIGVITILIAIGNLSFVYASVMQQDMSDGLDMVYHRVAAQSLLYHFIDYDLNLITNNATEFTNEIGVITKLKFNLMEYLKSDNEPIGLFKLNKVYDVESYQENIEKGYTLTSGFPGIVIYYFGFIISIFIVYILGKFLAYIYSIMYEFILNNSFIGIFMTLDLFNYIYSIFILGNIYYLFRLSFILRFILIILFKFQYKRIVLNKQIRISA